MKLAKDKKSLRVNDSLTLADIPPETFDYRLGNRSALEWVIDQYQIWFGGSGKEFLRFLLAGISDFGPRNNRPSPACAPCSKRLYDATSSTTPKPYSREVSLT